MQHGRHRSARAGALAARLRWLLVTACVVGVGCSRSTQQPGDAAAAELDLTTEVDAAGGRGLDCAVCRGAPRPCVCTLLASSTSALRDGPLASAGLLGPLGIAVGSGDALYVADWFAVRRIAAGRVTTVAGQARGGYRDGRAAGALFDTVSDVAVLSGGEIIVADQANDRVRRIGGGAVSTLAGGIEGYQDGLAATARFHAPVGVAVGSKGAIYMLDMHNHRIRRIDTASTTTGDIVITLTTVSTIAGKPSPNCKSLNEPALEACLGYNLRSLAIADDGTLYFTEDHRVRKLAGGWIRQVAGFGLADGYADGRTANQEDRYGTALFRAPVGLALDERGRLFVADSGNHVIRMIDKGQVTTYAGTGKRGGHDGPARKVAQFDDPRGLAIDSKGRLYVSELYPRRIRVILLE